MNNGIVIIAVLLILLVVVVAFFAILDRFFKGSPAKKTAEKKAEAPTPAQGETTDKPSIGNNTPSVMKIYNSELADDLDKMIKDFDDNQKNSRLQIENHMNKENNITKYIQEKKYNSFDFGDTGKSPEDEEKPMTFTREDYKRFVALSNIDDHKPL